MTSKEFYAYMQARFNAKYGVATTINEIMFDKKILYYYLNRYNQSWSTKIKDYVLFLRKIRLDLYTSAPEVSRRVKLNGELYKYYKDFNPESFYEYQQNKYEKQ